MSAVIEPPTCEHCGVPMQATRLHLFLGGTVVKRLRTHRCADERCLRQRDTLAWQHAFDRGECT